MNSTEESISFRSTFGVRRSKLIDPRLHLLPHHHVTRAFCARDGDGDHRFAVKSRECAAFGDRVGDDAEIVKADFAARGQADHCCGQARDCVAAGKRPNRFVAAADAGAAAGDVDDRAAQAMTDIERGQPHGFQSLRIERDQNLALDAADALDLRHAVHALQGADDDVVDVI